MSSTVVHINGQSHDAVFVRSYCSLGHIVSAISTDYPRSFLTLGTVAALIRTASVLGPPTKSLDWTSSNMHRSIT
jgi:hypothetical protein